MANLIYNADDILYKNLKLSNSRTNNKSALKTESDRYGGQSSIYARSSKLYQI